jgi:hypothetical protein
MKYMGFNIPDEIIDSYVDKLGCSIVDAMQAYLFDEGKLDNAEAEQLTKQAAVAGVGKMVGAATGSRPNRAKKVANETKIMVIQALFDTICAISDSATITNPEKYIDFVLNGEKYSINLVKHRKKD